MNSNTQSGWIDNYHVLPVRVYARIPNLNSINPLAFNEFLHHNDQIPLTERDKKIHWLPAREPRMEIISDNVIGYDAYELWSEHCLTRLHQYTKNNQPPPPPKEPKPDCFSDISMDNPPTKTPTYNPVHIQSTTIDPRMRCPPSMSPVMPTVPVERTINEPRTSTPMQVNEHVYDCIQVDSVADLIEFVETNKINKSNPFYYIDLTTKEKKVMEVSIQTISSVMEEENPRPGPASFNNTKPGHRSRKQKTPDLVEYPLKTKSILNKTSRAIKAMMKRRRKLTDSYTEKPGFAHVLPAEPLASPEKRCRNSSSSSSCTSLHGTYV